MLMFRELAGLLSKERVRDADVIATDLEIQVARRSTAKNR
jgi:hypothetical protein